MKCRPSRVWLTRRKGPGLFFCAALVTGSRITTVAIAAIRAPPCRAGSIPAGATTGGIAAAGLPIAPQRANAANIPQGKGPFARRRNPRKRLYSGEMRLERLQPPRPFAKGALLPPRGGPNPSDFAVLMI